MARRHFLQSTQNMAQRSLGLAKRLARHICAEVDLGEDALILLEPSDTSSVFLRKLINLGLPDAAINYLCHALPGDLALTWACQTLRLNTELVRYDVIIKVVDECESWLKRPTPEISRTMNRLSIRENDSGALGLLAMAVQNLDNGTKCREYGRPVSRRIVGGAVFGLLMYSIVATSPSNLRTCYDAILKRGLNLAKQIELVSS